MTKLSEMEKAWGKSVKNIFRFESIPFYRVPEDIILFEKWRKGKQINKTDFQEWFTFLEETKKRGVIIQRVRIVALPVSDYVKYEIDVWNHSKRYGETVFFLELKSYKELTKQVDFKPKDFWMFDNKTLVIFHYNNNGEFLREERIKDRKIIRKYRDLKRELLKNSIPKKQFLNDQSITKN